MITKKNQKKLLFQAPPLDGVKDLAKKDFVFETKIGDGAFGQVWKVKNKKNHKIYACKQVLKEKVMKMIDQFRREVLIMYEIKHPHIIKIFSHFEDERNFYLIIEFAEGGTLFEKLVKEKTFLEKSANNYFKQILSAIEFLHSHKPAIIHRDLKPENVLVDKQGNLKLTDFGWSNFYSVEQPIPRYTVCGTVEYLSPEMVKEEGHTPAVDIWCLGILLFEMLCGFTPFRAQVKDEILNNISKAKIKFPNNISQSAKNLILKTLEKNPSQRCTINDIKIHPWTNSFNDEKSKHVEKSQNEKNFTSNETISTSVGTDNEKDLNSFRASIYKIKKDLHTRIENCKKIREDLKKTANEIINENANEKLIEHDIIIKKKESLKFDQNIKDLIEKNSDCNIQLEKLEDLKGKDYYLDLCTITKFEIDQKSTEIEKLKEIQHKLACKLLDINEKCIDRERYLINFKQYLKKIKSKGDFLHQHKLSRLNELQKSCEFFKNQINKHSKILEKIKFPENEIALEMATLITDQKKIICENFRTEEKLKIIEEKITVKEVEIEKIKIFYLDQKSKIIKKGRIDKERAMLSNQEKISLSKKVKEMFSTKEIYESQLEKSRNLKRNYILQNVDISNIREKAKVMYI